MGMKPATIFKFWVSISYHFAHLISYSFPSSFSSSSTHPSTSSTPPPLSAPPLPSSSSSSFLLLLVLPLLLLSLLLLVSSLGTTGLQFAISVTLPINLHLGNFTYLLAFLASESIWVCDCQSSSLAFTSLPVIISLLYLTLTFCLPSAETLPSNLICSTLTLWYLAHCTSLTINLNQLQLCNT